MKIKNTSIVGLSLACILGINSCGGGGSGEQGSSDLIAHAGFDQTIRSGSQVILSGKNSEKIHAIETRTWQSISDIREGVLVPQRNKGAAKFVAPKVTEPETFEFGYKLTDVKGNVSRDKVLINVVPGDDANKFLNQNFRNQERIKIVVGSETEESLTAPTTFKVTMDLVANHGTTTETVAEVQQEIAGEWYGKTGGQSSDSANNPSLWFDLPQLYLSDLPDIIDQKVIPDEVGVSLKVSSSTSGSVTPFLYVYAGNTLLKSGKSPLSFDYNQARTLLGSDSRGRAENYYASIDPGRKKLTLCHWKVENGITPELEQQSVENGIVEVEDGRIIHQKYINGYDLGFARDMYVYQKNSGELAAWVVNYPFVDAMDKKTDAIATVVMEYGPLNGAGESFTRFYTYIESLNENLSENYLVNNHTIPADDPCYNTDGTPRSDQGLNPADFRRKLSYGLDFDGRGYRYMPEACTVCHGGIGLTEDIANNGNVQANFLPWDIHNLFFDDKNFETRPKSTADGELRLLLKDTSEDNFRALNESILQSRPTTNNDPIRELVHGWYGGEISKNSLPEKSVFNGQFVPSGWSDRPDMYRKVVGPMCRTCHIARTNDSGLAFTTESQFSDYINSNNRGLIEDQRAMPLARLTMDNLWGELDIGKGNKNSLAVLSEYLGGDLKRNVLPFALIKASGSLSIKPNETLILDAYASNHYQSLKWSVSSSAETNFTLDNGLQTGFSASTAGSYSITLTLVNGDQTETDKVTVVVSGESGGPSTGGEDSTTVQNGKSKFKTTCQTCHSTKDVSGGPNTVLTCYGNSVKKDLGSINSQMNNISLTDADVVNLRAYLNSFLDCRTNVKPQAKAGTYSAVKDNDDNGREDVQLDGSASSDAEDDNSKLKFNWSLNGNTIGTAAETKYAFNVGTHTVTLTVTDSAGASASDTAKIVVEKATAPEKSPVDQGKDLFSSVGCDSCHKAPDLKEPGGISAKCGSTDDIRRMATDVLSKNLSNGDVSNIKSYLDSLPCEEEVANTAPTAKIANSPKITKQADSVNSNGQQFIRFTLDGRGSTDSETPNNLKYEWRCGSGGVAGTESTYTRDFTVGQCDWSLKVIDPQGASHTATIDVTVTEASKDLGSAKFDKSSYSYNEGDGRVKLNITRTGGLSGDLKMHFRVTPSGSSGATFVSDYNTIDGDDNITIGDGKSDASVSFDLVDDSETENTEEFTIMLYRGYYDAGASSLETLATAKVQIQDNDTTSNTAPTARAGNDQTVTDTNGDGKETITLNGSGSTDPDQSSDSLSYEWSVGSTTFYGRVVERSFNVGGPYTVQLKVTDSDNASGTDELKVTVKEKEPTDAERGEDVFANKCDTCHDNKEGVGGGQDFPSTCSRIIGTMTGGMDGISLTVNERKYLKAYMGCS